MDWRPLDATTAAMVFATASLGAIGMMLTIEAYRAGEVSALAPLPYLRLVFAIAVGMVLFAEVPTAAMLAGGGIIIVCTLMVRPPWRRRGVRAPLP
jgi:drug/metabolite transporter (DMT)-like permease